MKVFILLALLAFAISRPLLGQCNSAPKYRPYDCYENEILDDDKEELKKLLEQFQDGGDDCVFGLFLGDMLDRKLFKEGVNTNEIDQSKCGSSPQYLPYVCYEPLVLRRDRTELKKAYDQYHSTNLTYFNTILSSLATSKTNYYERN